MDRNIKTPISIPLLGSASISSKASRVRRSSRFDGGKVLRNYYFNDRGGFQTVNVTKKSKELEHDSKRSFYLGKHPIREGSRQQRFFKSPPPCADFYRANYNLFSDREIDVERNLVSVGCWDTNKTTLQRTMVVDDTFGSNSDFLTFLDAVKPIIFKIIKKIPFITLPSCNFEDANYCIFNSDTYAGFRYDKYLKQPSKESARESAKIIAKRRWQYIETCSRKKEEIKRDKIFPSIYTIGARNKRDYTYEPFEEATSRAVHMPEYHVEITVSPWIDQITEHFKEVKRGSIYIGHSFIDYLRLEEVFRNSKKIFEGDWKRFDSTLYKNIKICGLALLRCFYKLDSTRIDNHFLAIADSILICDYYTPGGDIYRLVDGLPSGVKATNLLTSIINLIAIGFCIGERNIKNVDFVVGGDDFLFSFKKEIKNFDIDQVLRKAAELGMTFKFLKEKYTYAADIDDRPSFFKYTIKNGHPVIPYSALYERVLMPWNKVYKDGYDVYEFLRDIIPSLAHPTTACIPFYFLCSDVFYNATGRRYSVSEIFKRHQHIYRTVMWRKSGIFTKDKKIKVMSIAGPVSQKFKERFLLKTFLIVPCKFVKLNIL